MYIGLEYERTTVGKRLISFEAIVIDSDHGVKREGRKKRRLLCISTIFMFTGKPGESTLLAMRV